MAKFLEEALASSGHSLSAGAPASTWQEVAVTGKVTDENGAALPGVTVLLKGTNKAAPTDASGTYTITVPDGNGTLIFSYIGFESQEVPINGRSTINVTMATDAKALEEVVVVGYGTQSRGTVTGAVSQIEAQDIARTTATTATGALVGKIQGITARQADARPGAGTNIQVRNMGNPLYVIDGVTSDAGQFNNLDVNDIESVSVLKDASAAIYGLRAANGVILVTTKKGRAGQKPRISVNTYYGLQDFTRYPRPANAYQHQRGLVENAQNLGRPAPITPEELEKWRVGTEKGYISTDYYSMVMDEVAPQYYVNASASGGTENTNYHFSVSHINQDALIKDYNFNRTNFQANIETSLTKGLRVGTQIYGRVEDRYQIGVPGLDDYFNPFLSIFTMWPTERPYANDNPNYINQTHNVNVNPATYDKDVTGYIEETWRAAKGNFYAQYDFDFGLSAKATYSYNFTNLDFNGFEYTYNAYNYNETTDTYEMAGGNQNPWRERRKQNLVDKFAQFQLNYNKQFGNHGVSAVAAYERQDNDSHFMVVHTVPPNNYVPIMYFADQDLLIDRIGQSARVGYIGRVNYNYKEKYLLELLGRYDGSFLFAPGKRFGLFPGVSVGYRITEEDFMKGKVGFLNDLKLRASWGRTGSDIIFGNTYVVDPFAYLGGYTFNVGSAVFDDSYYSGVEPRDIPVTNLTWITNTTRNVGIDFTIFNHLRGQFDVFERKREGLPEGRYDVLLPSEVGYDLPDENLLVEANRGFEGALNYTGTAGEISYSVGVNGTFARRYDIAQQYKPRFGNSWDEYRNSWMDRWGSVNWGYQVVGRFQSQEEIDNHPVIIDGQGNRNLLPGDFIYKDVNGDNIINGLDERPIGYEQGANPYVSFGINTGVQYKGISLMMDFAGATMQSFRRNWELMYPYQNDGTSPDFMLEDRWHREDPYNSDSPWVPGTYPAIRRERAGHNYRHSDFWVTNVRYIRLRNLELSYSIPESITSRVGLSALRVYANGTNLFSIDNTKEFGIDPEISSGNGLQYPQQRIYTLGLNVSF
ncbi:SusC/RagA family TonB-linked outer membrane protein [Pontibacter toksunensis]|uniref:SusC/RagA family TonB-linked outer membrane protein n=1 Tax=Pontibacter toksunensis TaxID=1332631 RepID=A0ABW6C6G2_9BACT